MLAKPEPYEAFDVDAEQALLGAVFRDTAAFEKAIILISADDFYDPLHQRLFRQIGEMIERGDALSPITLHAVVKTDPGLVEAGGIKYLEALRLRAPTDPNIPGLSIVIRQHAARRLLKATAEELVERCQASPDEAPLAGLLDDARERLDEAVRLAEVTDHTQPYCLTLDSWLDRDLASPDFLLGSWLSTTSRMMLVAPTGLGKTNFTVALGMGMASGRGFLHWQGIRKSRVLFIDGEMSRRLMKVRLADGVRRMGEVPDTFFALSRDDVADMPPLNTSAGQAFVDRKIKEIGGVDFIIFDSVMCLLSGDMKDEESWQETLPWIRRLTQRGIGQCWVHHTGHDKSRSYGTSTREWQLDTVLLLEPSEQGGADIAFTTKFLKARERAPHNRTEFEPALVHLANDTWCVEAEVAGAPKSSGLTPTEKGWLNDLVDLFNTESPQTGSPASGLTPRPMLTRDQVREGLRRKNRFTLKPDGTLTGADRQKMSAVLNNLKDKCKIGMTKDHVWLQQERQ